MAHFKSSRVLQSWPSPVPSPPADVELLLMMMTIKNMMRMILVNMVMMRGMMKHINIKNILIYSFHFFII